MEYDSLRSLGESLGFTGTELTSFVEGRDGPASTGDGFDDCVATYQRMGLSAAEAKVAAIGRDQGETFARARFAEAQRVVEDSTRLDDAVNAAVVAEVAALRCSEASAREWIGRFVKTEWANATGSEPDRHAHVVRVLNAYEAGMRRRGGSPTPPAAARPVSRPGRRVGSPGRAVSLEAFLEEQGVVPPVRESKPAPARASRSERFSFVEETGRFTGRA